MQQINLLKDIFQWQALVNKVLHLGFKRGELRVNVDKLLKKVCALWS
jgi:hypothetical protein